MIVNGVPAHRRKRGQYSHPHADAVLERQGHDLGDREIAGSAWLPWIGIVRPRLSGHRERHLVPIRVLGKQEHRFKCVLSTREQLPHSEQPPPPSRHQRIRTYQPANHENTSSNRELRDKFLLALMHVCRKLGMMSGDEKHVRAYFLRCLQYSGMGSHGDSNPKIGTRAHLMRLIVGIGASRRLTLQGYNGGSSRKVIGVQFTINAHDVGDVYLTALVGSGSQPVCHTEDSMVWVRHKVDKLSGSDGEAAALVSISRFDMSLLVTQL